MFLTARFLGSCCLYIFKPHISLFSLLICCNSCCHLFFKHIFLCSSSSCLVVIVVFTSISNYMFLFSSFSSLLQTWFFNKTSLTWMSFVTFEVLMVLVVCFHPCIYISQVVLFILSHLMIHFLDFELTFCPFLLFFFLFSAYVNLLFCPLHIMKQLKIHLKFTSPNMNK